MGRLRPRIAAASLGAASVTVRSFSPEAMKASKAGLAFALMRKTKSSPRSRWASAIANEK